MIYLFYGENGYEAKRQVNRLIERFKSSTSSDFGLHKFNEEDDPQEVIQAVTSVSMFSAHSLVIVEHPSRSKALLEKLEPELINVPSETVLVVYDPQIDKRTSWFKSLQKNAKTKEFKARSEAELKRLAQKEASGLDVNFSNEALDLLVEYAGVDEWRLQNEIVKLSNLGKKVEVSDIKSLVLPAPRQTIFTLLDTLAGGNIEKSLGYLDDLRQQKIHELEVISMLGWWLRTLLVIASSDAPDNQVAKDHGINPYVLRKSKALASSLSVKNIQSAYVEVMEVDHAIKTTQHEPHILLEQLLMNLQAYIVKD